MKWSASVRSSAINSVVCLMAFVYSLRWIGLMARLRMIAMACGTYPSPFLAMVLAVDGIARVMAVVLDSLVIPLVVVHVGGGHPPLFLADEDQDDFLADRSPETSNASHSSATRSGASARPTTACRPGR
jgi:hypothetical protein